MKINCTIIKLFAALLLVLFLPSCNKFLDKKSNYGLQSPNTIESLQGILDNSIDMNKKIPSFGDIHADDYFLTEKGYSALAEKPRGFYTWTGISYSYPNDWASLYIPVYQVNVVLDALPQVDATKAVKDRVLGGALFYRAYQYLHGLWVYAKAFDVQTADQDLGIVLRRDADQTVPSKRSSVRTCYNQIIGDLLTAATLLPEFAESPMRPSKLACYGALSRTYLAIAKYDSAFYYADRVLQLKNDLLDYNDFTEQDLMKPYPVPQMNKETIFYAQLTTTNPNLHPNNGLVDTTLYSSYAESDIRKSLFFRSRNGYHSFKGSYTAAFNLFGGLAVDELLLIRAETNIRLGRVKKGLDDLNTLLTKRVKKGQFVPYYGVSQPHALKLIKIERRKELLMRGLRWIDIKRYNKYDGDNLKLIRFIGGTKYELEPNSEKYALPLPADIIQITGIEQNPF